jgi:hypothetical protein
MDVRSSPVTDGRRRSPSTRIPGPCVTQNNVLMVDKSSYNAYIGVLRATSTYTEKFSGSFMSSVIAGNIFGLNGSCS